MTSLHDTGADAQSKTAPPAEDPSLSCSWRRWIEEYSPVKHTPRDAEANTAEGHATLRPSVDVVVVGSGYGGAVAALRLAEKGFRVLVLERGSEFLPGDFPNHFSQLTNYVRANIPTHAMPAGRASGLFEFSVGQGIVGVTGNGLGGGSLINAGVVLRPDDEVFAQSSWPAAIRTAQPADPGNGASLTLDSAFDRAHVELGATPFAPPNGGLLNKTTRFKESLGELVQVKGAHPNTPAGKLGNVSLTIRSGKAGACIQCGDCASGCNTAGAKGDLRSTYLARAVATGRVQIVTQAQVYRFAPHLNDVVHQSQAATSQVQDGWKLWVFATDEQHHKFSPEEAGHLEAGKHRPSTLRIVRAPRLIISAGTLGSTQLLQRSQALLGSSLAFSASLGTRLSGNGDSLSAMVSTDGKPVEARGWGSVPPGAKPPPVGPTITAMWDGREGRLPLTERIVLQDGVVPGALGRLFEEVLAGGKVMQQMDDWSGGHPFPKEDRLAASDALARHTQIWLSMGHDGSPGRILWMPGSDASAMVMPAPDQLDTYRAQQRLFDRMAGTGLHLHSPLWQPLPKAATSLMSGRSPSPVVTSVHLLGGCPMGDDPQTSVVDHLGRAWIRDPSHPDRRWATAAAHLPGRQPLPNEPQVYPGLYVLDGSVVPTSLGCNPLWTITALAERAVSAWPDVHGPVQKFPASRNPARPAVAPQLAPVQWEMKLRETLQATAAATGPWGGQRAMPLRLDVEFHSQDFEEMLRLKNHPIPISRVELQLDDGTKYGLPPGAAPEFHFLPDPGWRSHGWWPLLWASIELLAPFPLPLLLAIWSLIESCRGEWALSALLLALSLLTFVILILLACLFLPFWRTFMTWLEGGGWLDLREMWRAPPEGPNTPWGRMKRFWHGATNRVLKGILGFRQIVHAREKRVMRYRLELERVSGSSLQPKRIYLDGRKRVTYRATVVETLRWMACLFSGKLKAQIANGRAVAVPRLRPTFWERIMDADTTIKVKGTRRVMFKGSLHMGLDQFLSPATAQLGERGDTTTGLLTLAGYGSLALRFAALTHLTDFRAPSYSGIPTADASNCDDVQIRVNGLRLSPQLHWIQVPRGDSRSDAGSESTRDLRLRLWQYPQQDCKLDHTEVCGAVRAKAVLLLHAFGQSGLTYTHKDPTAAQHQNLAEHLYKEGFEVWVLDSRMSTRSGYAESPFSVDMMAEHDVPAAVDAVIASCRQRLKSPTARPGSDEGPIQIALFGQCIGSASAWMSILSGKLGHGTTSKLYALASSQVHPLMVAAEGTQKKTGVPLLLRHLLPYMPFAVREKPTSLVWQLMDRLLSSFPAPDAERGDGANADAMATCRRIRFVEAPLFRHENMSAYTIGQMPKLFGNANLRLFSHARRFVEPAKSLTPNYPKGTGRLVDEDGFERYVIASNAWKHVCFPVLLLHGRKNELFDYRSVLASLRWLRGAGAWHKGSAACIVRGYGHLDVLLGRDAHQQVFPHISGFLTQAFHQETDCAGRDNVATSASSWRRVEPLRGPVLDWVEKQNKQWLVRCSMVLSVTDADPTSSSVEFLLLLKRPGGTTDVAPIYHYGRTHKAIQFHEKSKKNRQGFTIAHWIRLEIPVTEQYVSFDIEVHAFVGGVRAEAFPFVDKEGTDIEKLLLSYLGNGPEHTEERTRTQATLRISEKTTRATDGQCKEVDFWAACCRYPGWTIDAERIDAMAEKAMNGEHPAMALLVGDQIYADATAGLLDPTSPVERYFERHLTAFNTPTMAKWMRQIPTVMTPDDHEWIDNHPHASPLLKWPWPDPDKKSEYKKRDGAIANWAKKSIRFFQKSQWPGELYFAPPAQLGPVRLFVMDSRMSRFPGRLEVVKPQVLFGSLAAWLNALDPSHLPVIVSGSVVLPGLHPEADPSHPGVLDTWQLAPQQRVALLKLLCKLGRPFVLLSGDYHVSGAMEIKLNDKTVGAAVVAPPLYAPLPYANTRPHQVNTGEQLVLSAANCLTLQAVNNGQIVSGSGWCQLGVKRNVSGPPFTLQVTRTLRSLGEESIPANPLTAVINL